MPEENETIRGLLFSPIIDTKAKLLIRLKKNEQ